MIYSISTPGTNDLLTAYNPIYINVFTTGVNPVVYVDVYFNGIYYKTIQRNTPFSAIFGFVWWLVDIRDAAQEYLRAVPPVHSIYSIQQINNGYAACTVRVRGSSLVGGYLTPDSPIPVQATVDNAAVSGGGSTAATWYVLNAALQMEDLPDLVTFLAAGTVSGPNSHMGAPYNWYNLWTNDYIEVDPDDHLWLPILFPAGGFDFYGPSMPLAVTIENDGAPGFFYPIALNQSFGINNVYYFPVGPKQLATMAPVPGWPLGGSPPIDWTKTKWYQFTLEEGTWGNGVMYRSPFISVVRGCRDRKRFFFVNWLGHYEYIVFERHQEDYETKSEVWQKYNAHSFNGAGKEQFGKMRFNIHSAERLTVSGTFKERDMRLVKQFLSTPIAYMETKGTNGQADYMTPCMVQDGSITTRKSEERWFIEVTAELVMSNERINIRN